MDWSPDFCLNCDKQTADGEAYCGQACRLADLERAWPAKSPTATSRPASTQWPASNSTSRHPRAPSTPSTSTFSYSSQPTLQRASHSYSSSTRVAQDATGRLSPSSSRSSLSSSSEQATRWSLQFSEETQRALQSYMSSFEQQRNRRRTTLL